MIQAWLAGKVGATAARILLPVAGAGLIGLALWGAWTYHRWQIDRLTVERDQAVLKADRVSLRLDTWKTQVKQANDRAIAHDQAVRANNDRIRKVLARRNAEPATARTRIEKEYVYLDSNACAGGRVLHAGSDRGAGARDQGPGGNADDSIPTVTAAAAQASIDQTWEQCSALMQFLHDASGFVGRLQADQVGP